MSSTKRPARFGPFHRRLYFAGENEKIAASGEIWGRPRSNIYAGDFPAVKAWAGPLPEGIEGTEFYTDVEPDPWSVPGAPTWRRSPRCHHSGTEATRLDQGCRDQTGAGTRLMRAAKPSELTERALPVLAAKVSESELSRLIPVPLQDINDPDATAEPSKGALIQLAAGPFVVLFYGKESGRLTLELPTSGDVQAELRSFLREVPIPTSRIVWMRPGIAVADRNETPPPAKAKRVPKDTVRASDARSIKHTVRSTDTDRFVTRDAASKTTKRSPSARASKKR